MLKGKNVLITGAHGMIGRELFLLLKEEGAFIQTADLKQGIDLRNYNECLSITKDMDYVFHLAGIKGNPKMTNEKPVSFMGPMLQFDTNMILASQINNVKGFLYTSSIAVLNPEQDRFPAWAKSTGEKLIEAMRIQHKGNYCIVRPANVYGKFDDFKNENLMVISSLIKKGLTNQVLEVWGDGSNERDFINAKDVARGMILAMKNMPIEPINLCSGVGVKISEVAEIIKDEMKLTGVKYVQGITGSQSRIMKSNGDLIGFKPEVKLRDGIKEVVNWKQKYWINPKE